MDHTAVSGGNETGGSEADAGETSTPRRWWRWLVLDIVVVAALVGAWAMFVGQTTTDTVTWAPSSATGTTTPPGAVVWATQCPNIRATRLPGVTIGQATYVTSDGAEPPGQMPPLPSGNQVRITRYWLRSPRVVFVAHDGRTVTLHRLTRFFATSCAIQ